jgi:hypothetical protein
VTENARSEYPVPVTVHDFNDSVDYPTLMRALKEARL